MPQVTTEENISTMKRCPRFESCNAPICPLDYFQDERVKLTGDDKCNVSKSIRKRIGAESNLPYQGMTKKEWSGMKNWDAKSDQEKRDITERGKKTLEKIRQNLV